MHNVLNKLATTLIAAALLWSCGKDDGPKEFDNFAAVIYDQAFNLSGTITDAQEIGLVKAYDSNMGTVLTYAITTDHNDLFQIGETTGLLKLKAGKELNLSVDPLQKITVSVTDGEGEMDDAQITICDCTPRFVQESYEFEMEEAISDAVLIHTFEVADADTAAAELIFGIPTNDNSLFEINELGELSLAPGKSLDFETATEHDIIVSVTDGTETSEVEVKILVLNVVEGLADDPESFITKWQTQGDGEQIVIGANSNYGYDFTVDWGDGTVEDVMEINPETFEHIYEVAGTYTVAIKGDFPAIQMINTSTVDKLVGIEQWGNINWKDFSFAFRNCSNMVYNATDSPNLSGVTSMEAMFMEAVSFTADLNDWDTSSVTNMSHTFRNATSFMGDIGDWDTSNVTQMQYMFAGAIQFNKDLDDWVTSKVVNMANMFRGATNFNGNIDNWNTANVDLMTTMFQDASNFNRNIGAWNTGNVTFMLGMFHNAESFNGNIADWDTSNVESAANMFNGASAFSRNIGAWNILKITNMEGMFDNSGMTQESYGLTLQFWAQDANIQSDITLGALGLQVNCDFPAIIAARDYLINTKGWIITDTPCP